MAKSYALKKHCQGEYAGKGEARVWRDSPHAKVLNARAHPEAVPMPPSNPPNIVVHVHTSPGIKS